MLGLICWILSKIIFFVGLIIGTQGAVDIIVTVWMVFSVMVAVVRVRKAVVVRVWKAVVGRVRKAVVVRVRKAVVVRVRKAAVVRVRKAVAGIEYKAVVVTIFWKAVVASCR
mgnify:CR=1 FL=1